MNKITIKNLVPMSREELKIRGLKNHRTKNVLQLIYVDGLGHLEMLLGKENESELFGNMAKKWPEYIKHNLNIKYINEKMNSCSYKTVILLEAI
jgi:hypothetical protein